MQNDVVTRYHVDRLVQARKFALRPTRNTLYVNDPELKRCEISVPIRRVDNPATDLVLVFDAHDKTKSPSGIRALIKPSAALLWHGKRIRGVDHTLKHPIVDNGVPTGYIRGWHEHFWTDTDEDDSIRAPDPPPKNEDLASIIEWCSENWNIEGIPSSLELF